MLLLLFFFFFSCILACIGIFSGAFRDFLRTWIRASIPQNLDFMPRKTSMMVANIGALGVALMLAGFCQSSILRWRDLPGFSFTYFGSCGDDASCLLLQVAGRILGATVIVTGGLFVGILLADPAKLFDLHGLGLSYRLAAILLFSVLLCFVPNAFITTLIGGSVMMTPLYLLMQTMTVIEICYTWNDNWVKNAERSDGSPSRRGKTQWYSITCGTALFLCSLVGLASLVLHRYLDSLFARHILCIHSAVAVAGTFLSCTVVCPNGALLTSAAVFVYSFIQLCFCYVSLLARPEQHYAISMTKLIASTFFLLGTLHFSHSHLAAPTEPEMVFEAPDPHAQQQQAYENERPQHMGFQPQHPGAMHRRGSEQSRSGQPPAKMATSVPLPSTETVRQYRVYHAVSVFAACFLMVLATNWLRPAALFPPEEESAFVGIGVSEYLRAQFASLAKHPLIQDRLIAAKDPLLEATSQNSMDFIINSSLSGLWDAPMVFWLELLAGPCATALLYSWTLAAPLILPSRDFDSI